MTICSTGRVTTTYCCNDWAGRRCDCSYQDTPRVILDLLQPVATIAAKNALEGSTATTTPNDIHWNAVRPVLVAGMTLCILSMLLYLGRMTYIAKRRGDPSYRSPSFVEHEGRRFSDFFGV